MKRQSLLVATAICLLLTRVLVSVMFVNSIGSHANAASIWTQLEPHNIDRQRLSFTINADKVGANVHFQVSVESKGEPLSSFLQAYLEVLDGTNRIVGCSVEKTQRDKGAVYEFEVSSKYLAQSRFTFGNMAASNGRPMPAGDLYWFYLKDFSDQK